MGKGDKPDLGERTNDQAQLHTETLFGGQPDGSQSQRGQTSLFEMQMPSHWISGQGWKILSQAPPPPYKVHLQVWFF